MIKLVSSPDSATGDVTLQCGVNSSGAAINANILDGSGAKERLDCNGDAWDPDCSNTIQYDAQNRIRSVNGTAYTYNRLGQLTQGLTANGKFEFEYDVRGNLRRAFNALDVSYEIDGRDRLVGRTARNGTQGVIEQRRWLYKDQLEPVAEIEYDSAGKVKALKKFIYGTQRHVPDAMTVLTWPTAGSATPAPSVYTYRFIKNHLGTVRALVGTNCTSSTPQSFFAECMIRVGEDYAQAFGHARLGQTVQPFGFAGGIQDPHTGFVRFGARDYDPATGRWTARDPILFDGGQSNLYAYCDNDPVNCIDPTGLLFNGLLNAGEGYGDSAAQYWANAYENSSGLAAAGAAIMGGIASLWTPCTSDQTFTTLSAAYALNAYAGRSFWRYVGDNARPDGKWLTRGNGWSAPYGRNFGAAKDALQLPKTPTDVIKVPSRWNEFVSGPRTVSGNPQWGGGGGTEYFRGWGFP